MSTVLYSCDPDSSGAKTYTTTVSGKVITPGLAADPTKGSTIGTAKVWADPAKKVAAKADGSYSLKVTHSGNFTLTADYTGADGNYKASAPQTVKTSQTSHNQNIALKYGHTSNAEGRVAVFPRGTGFTGSMQNGVKVVAEVEGVAVAESETRTIGGRSGSYSFSVAHNGGKIIIRASYTGMSPDYTTRANVGNSAIISFAVIDLEP